MLGSLNKWQLGSFLKHSAPPFSSLQEYQIDGLLVQSDRAMQAVRHLSAQNLHLLKAAAAKAYTTSFSITMFVAALFGLITLTLVSMLPRKK